MRFGLGGVAAAEQDAAPLGNGRKRSEKNALAIGAGRIPYESGTLHGI